ncbi:MAG: DUF4836 family protein [Prevotellaceae bacterium]|jgi:hypothetical protein|nr:DUF4836 family protein [Prevotellaceae bacterium]
MKFSKITFYLSILGCTLFASCKTDVSTTNHLAFIPGNAKLVFEIRGNEIFAKSGLNNPDNYVFFGIMKNFLDAGAVNFIESFLKGSKDAGISAEKILFYMTELPEFTLTVPVVNKTALENWLKKAGAPEPLDEGNFRHIPIETNLNIAWNDNLAMITGVSTREKIAAQFNSKDDGLLATNSDFQQFAKKNADIRMWFKYSVVSDFYKNIMGLLTVGEYNNELLDDVFKNFATLSTHSYLNFEDGKITGTSSGYPPEEVEKMKEKFPVLKKDFNTDVIKDMPEQSYLAFNVFINVKEYIKIMRQNIEAMASGNHIYSHEIGSKVELLELLDSPKVKSIVDALGGDILINIHGFNKGIIAYPLASASLTVNGESTFNDILNLIPKNLYTKQDSYYTITANKTFIPVYFAYRKDRIFVSVDLDAVKAFTGEMKGKTFADNPVSKIMADKMVFYINLDFSTYPDNIKLLLQNTMGVNQYVMFNSFIDIYESMYFSSDTQYNTEFNLQLKNKNVNSLKQILKNIDKTSSSIWTN